MTAQRTISTQSSKKLLLDKKHELESRVFRREDIAIAKSAEEMDVLQQSADRVLALDSLTRQWETSSLITEALERIERETYGNCAECDEPISEKRLRAIPWARFCITCQDAIDRARAEEQRAA